MVSKDKMNTVQYIFYQEWKSSSWQENENAHVFLKGTTTGFMNESIFLIRSKSRSTHEKVRVERIRHIYLIIVRIGIDFWFIILIAVMIKINMKNNSINQSFKKTVSYFKRVETCGTTVEEDCTVRVLYQYYCFVTFTQDPKRCHEKVGVMTERWLNSMMIEFEIHSMAGWLMIDDSFIHLFDDDWLIHSFIHRFDSIHSIYNLKIDWWFIHSFIHSPFDHWLIDWF